MKSIVTKYDEISVFSPRKKECDHHLIGGIGLRELADQDGLTIPLTNEEHNTGQRAIERVHGNTAAEKLSKIAGQLAYEKEYYRRQCEEEDQDPAREDFRRRYGKSYL